MSDPRIPPHYWPVKFLEGEDVKIRQLAQQRMDAASRYGYKQLAGGMNHEIIGMAGEIAVSMVLGVKVNKLVVSPDELSESDIGSKIEVKTRGDSNERFWDMAVNKHGIKKDRIYILYLAHLYPQYVIVAGWTWGNKITERNQLNTNSYKGQPFYIYPRSELYTVNDLFDELRGNHG